MFSPLAPLGRGAGDEAQSLARHLSESPLTLLPEEARGT